MRLLITGDLQVDAQNLDLCQQAWDEMLAAATAENVQAIIIAGDLKHAYNPVDVRVIKWVQRAISSANKAGFPVIVNLGNHDRLGPHNDNENWFPILRKAGAICIDREPVVRSVGDGQVAFLPFCKDKALLKERARGLSNLITSDKSVLIFHEDVRNCKYNILGKRSENGIELEALYPTSYRYCVGGHIHLHQKIGGNAYYTGSPFATDWGEANQKKGFVLITDRGADLQLEFRQSKLPGWFDESWPGFWEPDSWKGCNVRVHFDCRNSVEYVQRSARARIEAEKRFQGAEIFISPNFVSDETNGKFKLNAYDSDEVKIREYVKETCPDNLNRKETCEYLFSRLDSVTSRLRRLGTGIKVVRATAKNFLSFKELEIDWTQKGITIVQGKNKDRIGKSNGSGKTSSMQTIPVALFGTTFKGQKHDRWARRNAQGKASVHLEISSDQNHKIEIERCRKPTKLQLWVDGKDRTVGMNPALKDATQGEIEKLTGFTWQTLANAVYVDGEVSRAFLSGTKKERTQVLSKFQNLERFETALIAVRKDQSEARAKEVRVQTRITVLEERHRGLQRRYDVLLEESEVRTQQAWKEVVQRKRVWRSKDAELGGKIERLNAQLENLARKVEKLNGYVVAREQVLSGYRERDRRLRVDLGKLDDALHYSECPTCRQTVDRKRLEKAKAKARLQSQVTEIEMQHVELELRKTSLARQIAEGDYDTLNGKRNRVEAELNLAKFAYEDTYKQYREMKLREGQESDAKAEAREGLKATKAKLDNLRLVLKDISIDEQFYDYCEKAMSRDGIPAFLNALLCPTLNTAADYYSELFSDKAIQIRFEMENGEFIPTVLNATGGQDIDDQSDGEKALAGLIGSFALREAAPKCNLLLLDEPGHGLDPSTARQFARGLKELSRSKFESIWVTTHNAHILQELEGERTLTVVKKNGISYMN